MRSSVNYIFIMKFILPKAILCLLNMLLLAPSLVGQQADSNWVNIDSISFVFKEDGALEKAWSVDRVGAGSVVVKAEKLLEKIGKRTDSVPFEYFESMLYYTNLINACCDTLTYGVREDMQDLLDDIEQDLDIKLNAHPKIDNDSGVLYSPNLLLSITLEVQTRRSLILEDGYDVACTPIRYQYKDRPLYTFNNQTNKATRELPPGRYVVSISKGGDVLKERTVELRGPKLSQLVIFDLD